MNHWLLNHPFALTVYTGVFTILGVLIIPIYQFFFPPALVQPQLVYDGPVLVYPKKSMTGGIEMSLLSVDGDVARITFQKDEFPIAEKTFRTVDGGNGIACSLYLNNVRGAKIDAGVDGHLVCFKNPPR